MFRAHAEGRLQRREAGPVAARPGGLRRRAGPADRSWCSSLWSRHRAGAEAAEAGGSGAAPAAALCSAFLLLLLLSSSWLLPGLMAFPLPFGTFLLANLTVLLPAAEGEPGVRDPQTALDLPPVLVLTGSGRPEGAAAGEGCSHLSHNKELECWNRASEL